MEKYNKLLRNITELIEKGLFSSKELRKELEGSLKLKMEVIANQLNLVSREEFEVQKKLIEKLQKDLAKFKVKKNKKKITKAKKSIAAFSLREGMPIGCKVTLRKDRMYEFLDRLITIAIPRIRDFRGFSRKSFDGRGNYTLGIKEQIIFPEIDYEKIDSVRGLDIAISTSAKNDDEARLLLEEFNFPFRR